MPEKRILIYLFLLVFAALSVVPGRAQKTASAVSTTSTAEKPAQPMERPNDRSSDKGFGTNDFLPDDEKPPAVIKARVTQKRNVINGKVRLDIVMETPHNKQQENTLIAYPYPVELPKIKTPVKMLPTSTKQLATILLNTGYNQRQSLTLNRPFPSQGWRWQYAFNAAVRKGDLGLPHTIGEMYAWRDDMMRFIKPEIERSNDGEKMRISRYTEAARDYDENHYDYEQESVSNGLFPTEVKFETIDGRQTRYGHVYLLPGKWWLVGMHKVPGLKYYWQHPITIEENQPTKLDLTEADALMILGAW